MNLPGVSRSKSTLRERAILVSSRQNGQLFFLSCCGRCGVLTTETEISKRRSVG
ncbi:hypothetical protein HanXRQr2_Chr11g0474401 [Helianthus annuus]|uniref:Uncharacterized protein n=1 Tax=Helianthus annuus TaxID=4232 RepID=A0A9K3HLR2_HELAN|nr:hypothetical protein HanXRQr2_Chr11g0474401 [Helianthus annuus]KAJ0873867.1 hypothetical protein HanPSC8_Chr11g0457421 [Helianthus annuus]